MNKSFTSHTNISNSCEAGEALGREIKTHFNGESPDAVIVFASSRYNHNEFLQALIDNCHPKILVGSSSAGEFTQNSFEEGAACAMAFKSDQIKFSAGIGRNLHADRFSAARSVVNSFAGMKSHSHPYRSALIMTDALAGHADDFVEQITMMTGGTYKLFGGGAGDDAQFRKTHVFLGTEAIPDAAVSLEILSQKPIGVGVCHGWEPSGAPYRVTAAEGMRLISLNALPARHVLQEHAASTGQELDIAHPMPFFLHNVIGITTDSGYRLRVPLSIEADGSIQCAAEVPEGAMVYIMKPQRLSALEATKSALEQLGDNKPHAALFFDCVATRLRMGKEFGFEIQAVEKILGPDASLVGCNTYGQIARAEGQFNGFHNCTAVVCVFPA